MPAGPRFPPLLTGYPAPEGTRILPRAVKGAVAGKLGAGDIVWRANPERMEFALVLEPEVDRQRCYEMLFVTMVALGDALGAICPPEVAVTYGWPSSLLMNGADVGAVALAMAEGADESAPDYLVAGVHVEMRPALSDPNPGMDKDRTTLWDEGCGEVSSGALLESAARHLVNWIHNWSEDGFKPVHEAWWGRIDEKTRLSRALPAQDGELVGLDAQGNGLIKTAVATRLFEIADGLAQAERKGGS